MDILVLGEVHTERAGQEDLKRTEFRVSVGDHRCVSLVHASPLQFRSVAEKY
jgi:hypothetical protein